MAAEASTWDRLTTPMAHSNAKPWSSKTGLDKYPGTQHTTDTRASGTTTTQWHNSPSFRPSIFDRILPPHKRYLGRFRRRTFLCFIVLPMAIIFILLPIILGLAIGLSRARASSSSSSQLPLPASDTSAIYTGDLTYFSPALGACGVTSNDNSSICAISHIVFDAAATGSDPNQNPLCGKRIRIERAVRDGELGGDGDAAKAGNRTAVVTVVDRCTGCASLDLDLSPAVFGMLANPGEGRVGGSWSWVAQ